MRNLLMKFLLAVGATAVLLPMQCGAQPVNYTISTYAGSTSGTSGFTGDGGSPANAQFNTPIAVALDSSHNLYIADSANNRIRKISGGKISTIAGNGTAAYAGDGGAATSANLSAPYFLLPDPSGNLYISDLANQVVREVSTSGTITTVAGDNGYGFGGDGGPGPSAVMNHPFGLVMDSSGNLYIADSNNHRIRKLSSDGTISTVAGNGNQGYSGDGGPATSAKLNTPLGLGIDSAGNIYIADSGNNRVRKLAADGTISTVAGTGSTGFTGDGGPATKATLWRPFDVTVDAYGNLYIADYNNYRIREVTTNGLIYTIAGQPFVGYTGDGGPATNARFNYPTSVAVDSSGIIYIADSGNNVIRMLTPASPAVSSGGVISASAFGAFTSAAPGSWIEIYGSNLAFNARSWTSADFSGLNAPTSLDGTSVTVGGLPAYVDYISPGQVNAQIPSGVATGQQQLVVTTPAGSSTTLTVNVKATEPGLFAPSSFQIGGIQYVGATSSSGTAYIAPPGAVQGVTAQRAKVGDIITLYGVGFGAVSPNISAGVIVTQENTVAAPLQIFIGDVEASIQYAGLAPDSIGLYQFNVVVPNVGSNDATPVTFSLGGVSGTQVVYTAIQ